MSPVGLKLAACRKPQPCLRNQQTHERGTVCDKGEIAQEWQKIGIESLNADLLYVGTKCYIF